MIITLQQMYSNKETKESECQQLGARLQIFEPPTSVDGVGNIILNNLELQVLNIVIKWKLVLSRLI